VEKRKSVWESSLFRGIFIALVCTIVLGSGAAWATSGFNFWNGTASIAVNEPMQVWMGGVEQSSWTYTWNATIDPGESDNVDFVVKNTGTASLTARSEVTGDTTGLTVDMLSSDTIAGGGERVFKLTITVPGSAAPGTRTIYVKFYRE
jgi:hypothetical protein